MDKFIFEFFKDLNDLNKGIKLEGEFYKGDVDKLIVKMEGYLDTYNSDNFKDAMFEIIGNGEKIKLVIYDMSELVYISSTGVGALVAINKKSKQMKKGSYLFNMSEKVEEVLTLLGFMKFFNIINDLKVFFGEQPIEEKPIIKPTTEKLFPLIINCPNCKTRLKIPLPGKFRCPSCSAPIVVYDDSRIELVEKA